VTSLVICHGRHGEAEVFSGDIGSTIDMPVSVAKALRGRVEVVPSTTPIRGVPLQPHSITDD
jgi:hypothetical protein